MNFYCVLCSKSSNSGRECDLIGFDEDSVIVVYVRIHPGRAGSRRKSDPEFLDHRRRPQKEPCHGESFTQTDARASSEQ